MFNHLLESQSARAKSTFFTFVVNIINIIIYSQRLIYHNIEIICKSDNLRISRWKWSVKQVIIILLLTRLTLIPWKREITCAERRRNDGTKPIDHSSTILKFKGEQD